MSGKSYSTGSVRSGGGSVRLGPASAHQVVLDALYERKRDKKSVRVLTVIIYVFCVSLAAIMLSLYYVFFWEPKDAQYAQRKVPRTVEPQTSTAAPMPTCFIPHTGGSDTTVKESVIQPMPVDISSLPTPTLAPTSITELASTASSLEDVTTDYTTEAVNDTSGGDVYNFNVTDTAV